MSVLKGQLLPCPFCGNKAIIIREPEFGIPFAECMLCCACGPKNENWRDQTVSQAGEDWNRREPEPWVKVLKDHGVEELWHTFGDIPMNPETECIEVSFLDFPTGTHREEIWHWFDEQHSKGVAYLLYGEEV